MRGAHKLMRRLLVGWALFHPVGGRLRLCSFAASHARISKVRADAAGVARGEARV
jgi:hypothetical protein